MTSPEKPRRPWWFRLLKFLLFLALGLVTLVALVVSVENWRGERAWRKYEAELKAAGERLTFAEIVPPMPPADQNFGSLPLFARLLDYRPESAVDTNAEAAFRVFYLPRLTGEESAGDELAALAAKFRELATNAPGGLQHLPGYPVAAPGASDAEVVLTALRVADAEVGEVCAALDRPFSRFGVHYEEGFMALLPHLAQMKGVQAHLRMRVKARLAAGQGDVAWEELGCAMRLAGVLRDEPLLISQLVHFAQASAVMGSVHPGIQSHAWTDGQLARFQEWLRSRDYLGAMRLAFEGERAGGNQTLAAMIGRRELVETLGVFDAGSGMDEFLAVGRRIPRGFIRQNQIHLNRYHTGVLEALRAPDASADLPGLLRRVRELQAASEADAAGFSPYRIFTKLLIPATAKAVEKAVRMEILTRLMDVGCALERHRIARGNYPESLSDLDLGLLTGPALDPMSGQRLRYERLDDGTFRLWSVGLDGRDDDGVSKRKRSGPELDLPWPRPGDEFRPF